MYRTVWRDGRVVEGARLEIVCASKAYRGFESLSLRHYNRALPCGGFCYNELRRMGFEPEKRGFGARAKGGRKHAGERKRMSE